MLFLLTGDVQIGKTRWLMRVINELEESGVLVSGVLNPGVWRHRCPQEIEQAGETDACGEYEKLGIDAMLLPGRERFPFARPATWDAELDDPQGVNQSRKAKLAWDISEEALATINAHFDMLQAQAASNAKPGLAVIDELGRLELDFDGGLTSALHMVDAGPTEAFPHVIAVVREWLLDAAHQRFGEAWHGDVVDIVPDETSVQTLFEALASLK